jgi:hypothetical protein
MDRVVWRENGSIKPPVARLAREEAKETDQLRSMGLLGSPDDVAEVSYKVAGAIPSRCSPE